ncbi:hypothetical protein ACJMK2_007214, partial [Sinanodonta woodiana]
FSAANLYCENPGMTSNDTQQESSQELVSFAKVYAHYHGYISICVCLFGIITNIFNITVLTRKAMRTPVNHILSWLAVSDVITMVSYVPFALHFYCMYPSGSKTVRKNSQSWMTFMIFHINLTATTHTISIWLCVTLAIVRFLHIRIPTKGNAARIRRIYQAKVMVFIVCIASTLILIPNYMSNQLLKDHENETNDTVYVLRDLKLGRNDTELLVLINVWVYALIAKLVPCMLMAIFGSLLIYNIHVKIRHRRKILQISGSNSVRLSEHSRTTKMLLAVIVLFLLTELPQGVLIVCSACIENFFDRVYIPLGDVMDIVALVNNAVNFILYCSMSSKFRQTLVHLYCGAFLRRRTHENGYTLADSVLSKPEGHSKNRGEQS